MKRPKLPKITKPSDVSLNAVAAFAISVISLAVSIWAVVESRNATRQARWTDFRSTTLATLERHWRAYDLASCVLTATDIKRGQAEFARYKSNIEKLESQIYSMKSTDSESLSRLEAMLDAANSSFREINAEVNSYKTLLTKEDLERVNSICGSQN